MNVQNRDDPIGSGGKYPPRALERGCPDDTVDGEEEVKRVLKDTEPVNDVLKTLNSEETISRFRGCDKTTARPRTRTDGSSETPSESAQSGSWMIQIGEFLSSAREDKRKNSVTEFESTTVNERNCHVRSN